ncbi:MAG: helix-turn-helix transcriptional regulator [Clostridia bacterium]|nr:helix-turn-helix transcriptional regulator [Clostridia bacterium]
MDKGIIGVGEKIRFHRNRVGWSQERLALEAGINSGFLGCVERGEKTPTMRTLEKIAEALEITVPYLCVFGDEADVDDLAAYGDKYAMIIKEVAPEKRDAFTEAVAALAALTKASDDKI